MATFKRSRFWALFLAGCLLFPAVAPAEDFSLNPQDRDLLKKIQKDTFYYFTRMSDKETGLTRDSSRPGSPASIAATGFSLAALAIGASNKWVPEEWAYEALRKTLKNLLTKAQHEHGFFYHFLDPRSSRRVWASEASSIDTALLVAGALVAAQYYPGTDIERMAHELYNRVDWQWMQNGNDLVCMGWKPESGFLPYYWDTYNEHLIIQALAIGSPTHAIGRNAWNAWQRLEDDYNGHHVVYGNSGSLFMYQFPQAFIDFRNLDDAGVNYFTNSREAALANRDYSLAVRHLHKGYSEFSWGLSASLGPGGYKAYGAKPGEGLEDGTIAPYAALSSIVFTPKESVATARFFFDQYANDLYSHFGFKDSFNLDKHWWAGEYIGIDQGVTLLMLENFLNDGIIWKKFMDLEAVKKWIEVCKLRAKGTTPSS
ncbi:MAG TPA: glucoamylase family protein [Verrucomicrobiae bacterium]|nr:glucoamylase family protein [Verrucomicrobiae bacterium]